MNIRSFVKVGLALMVAGNLTGCAMIAKKHELEKACDSAPVLYTDLKKPVYARHYALPNGQSCPISDGGSANA